MIVGTKTLVRMRYHRMHVRGWGNALSRRREKKVSSWNMEQQGEEEREKPLENSFLDLVTDHIKPDV